MERDSETQQKNESSPTNAAPTWAESNMIKSPIEKDERGMPEHDSMVTVRLSEPPSLSVNTDLPPNTLPFRRSIWGHECTPTSATAPVATSSLPAKEEEVIVEQEIELKTPADPPKTLLQELRDTTIAEEQEDRKDDNDQDLMDESDTEEVNWDQLQKTEDEEVKDQDDNVCCESYLFAYIISIFT